MATRYAGQKIRFNWGGISGGAANDRLSAFIVSGAVAGSEPLANGTFT
jgi:hypothetical protein